MEPNSTEKLARRVCIECSREFEGDETICPDDGHLLTPLVEDQLVGTVLADRYEILEVIGGGGMGLVYKARHRLMNRIVAIKMLHRHMISSAETLKRFQLEAQAASCLSLPNILTVYDFGLTPEGQPYMVMDYLEGTSLADVLENELHLTEDRAVNIFIQACSGLAHAHQKGVLHRDIKPSNIMLVTFGDQADFVKIVDFGIAKILTNQSHELTKTGEVHGSPMYMSPEQCRGKDTDARSDIYALGCVMYRTLTGQPLFSGDDVIELLFKQVSEPPTPFGSVAPQYDLSPEIEAVVFKALSKSAADRYQTMTEFKDALETYKEKRQAKPATPSVEAVKPLWKRPETQEHPKPRLGAGTVPALQQPVRPPDNGAHEEAVVAHYEPPAPPPARHSHGEQEPYFDEDEDEHQRHAHSAALRRKMNPENRTLVITISCISAVFMVAAGILFMLSKEQTNTTPPPGQSAPADNKITQTTESTSTETSNPVETKPDETKTVETKAPETQSPETKPADNASQPQPSAADDAMVHGKTALANKKYIEAKVFFLKALETEQNKNGRKSLQLAEPMLQLGRTWIGLKNYANAEHMIKESISIRESNSGRDSRELVPALQELVNLYRATNKLPNAQNTLERAISIQEKGAEKNDLTLANLQFALAQTLQAEGKQVQAQEFAQKALAAKQAALAADDPQVTEIQNFCNKVASADAEKPEVAAKQEVKRATRRRHRAATASTEQVSTPRRRHAYSSYGF